MDRRTFTKLAIVGSMSCSGCLSLEQPSNADIEWANATSDDLRVQLVLQTDKPLSDEHESVYDDTIKLKPTGSTRRVQEDVVPTQQYYVTLRILSGPDAPYVHDHFQWLPKGCDEQTLIVEIDSPSDVTFMQDSCGVR